MSNRVDGDVFLLGWSDSMLAGGVGRMQRMKRMTMSMMVEGGYQNSTMTHEIVLLIVEDPICVKLILNHRIWDKVVALILDVVCDDKIHLEQCLLIVVLLKMWKMRCVT